MSNYRYEFSINPIYDQYWQREKYKWYFMSFLMTVTVSMLTYIALDNVFLAVIIAILYLIIGGKTVHHYFTDVKLIIDLKGLSCNKFLYNIVLQFSFQWDQIDSVIAVPSQPEYDYLYRDYFLNLPPEKSEALKQATICIPTHKNRHHSQRLAFSDKVWVNPNITLQKAIEICRNQDCISASPIQENSWLEIIFYITIPIIILLVVIVVMMAVK